MKEKEVAATAIATATVVATKIKIEDLDQLLELCKEQKHSIDQGVDQHHNVELVLQQEHGDVDLLGTEQQLEQEEGKQEQVEEHLVDIVTDAKRVKVLQKRQKDLKKRLVVSAKRKDVDLGYSIYKIFLIYIE